MNNREKEKLIFSSKMVIAGEQTQDFVIEAPVAEVWAIYGTTKLSEIIRAKKFFEDIQIDGDGRVGTFINITPLPGGPLGKYKEKLVKVDHECRIKDADVIEGGYLNLGFTFFRTRFEILENGCNSSVLRVTIFYELEDEYAANASLVNVGEWQGSPNAVAEFLAEKAAKSAAC